LAEQVYECMFIFDPNRYARDPGGVSSKITQSVEKMGGEVLVSRLWIEQRLAYPINGHRKGVYWLTYIKLESTSNSKLNREFQLNENILRHLITKIDPRLVDSLVSLARGERVVPVAEEDSSESDDSSETDSRQAEPAAAET